MGGFWKSVPPFVWTALLGGLYFVVEQIGHEFAMRVDDLYAPVVVALVGLALKMIQVSMDDVEKHGPETMVSSSSYWKRVIVG